jgi:hypothetical protein
LSLAEGSGSQEFREQDFEVHLGSFQNRKGATRERIKTTRRKACRPSTARCTEKETPFVPKVVTKVRLEEQENQQDLPKGDKVPSVNLAGKNETGGTNAVAQSCSRVKLTLATARELRMAVVIERGNKDSAERRTANRA